MSIQRAMRIPRIRSVCVVLVIAGCAVAPQKLHAQSGTKKSVRQVYSKKAIAEKLKHSTCWLKGSRANGTGWVFDLKNRLVVTNHHVVDKNPKLKAYFPVKKNGEWQSGIDYYTKSVRPINAEVIHSDIVTDLALLQLDRLPKDIVALPLAPKSPPQGDQLHSLGAYTNGSSALWTYTFGHVRLVAPRGLTALRQYTRIVECQLEYNKGNSGGPIVNDSLQLVAVVEGYKVRGRSGAAVRNVSIAIDVQQVAAWLKESLPLVNPKSAQDFFKRGTRRYASRRYDAAIRDFSKAIVKDPKLTDAYIQRALAFYFGKQDYRTAISDLDEVIKKTGGNAEAYYARSIVYARRGKSKEAYADLTNAIRIAPGSWKYYYYRGKKAFDDKKYGDAISDFTRSISNDSKQYLPQFYKAYTNLRLKKHYSAISGFTTAIQLNPLDAAAHNNQGVAYYSLKDYKKAALKFRDAIRVKPTTALYHDNYGLSMHNQGLYRTAISSFDTAIKLSPYSKYYGNRGRAKHYLKQYDDAIKDFNEAIRRNSRDAKFYYYRGSSFKAKGFTSSSEKDFRKAAELNKATYGYLLKRQ